MKSLSRVQLFATPWTVAYQAPPSLGFFRQEYWSGLPFPSPGELSNPGIEPGSPEFQVDSFNCWATREAPVKWLNSTYSGFWYSVELEIMVLALDVCFAHKLFPRVLFTKYGPLIRSTNTGLWEAAVSGGMKWDLNSRPRNWTWVAWMRARNPSHQTSKG